MRGSGETTETDSERERQLCVRHGARELDRHLERERRQESKRERKRVRRQKGGDRKGETEKRASEPAIPCGKAGATCLSSFRPPSFLSTKEEKKENGIVTGIEPVTVHLDHERVRAVAINAP